MNPSIYVIAGKDESLVNTQRQQLINQLLTPEQRVVSLAVFEGSEAAASEVFDELRTAPFLAEKRVVVVKAADDFVSQNRPLLEKYFENPCPTGILVLAVTSWPAQTKLAKKLPKVGKLIEVAEPKRHQLPGLLAHYAAESHGKKIDRDAAELLIELTGDELARLYSEIDKLAVFADSEKAITAAHIESLIGHNRIFDAFEVIDSVLAHNTGQAVERLRRMFAADRNAEYTVVGAFAFHVRRMFTAKVMLEKGISPGNIAGKLRIWSNKDAFFAQLQHISLSQISAMLQELAGIDYAVKTGQTKATVAVERLVLRLSAIGSRQASG